MKLFLLLLLFCCSCMIYGKPILTLSSKSHNFGKFQANIGQKHSFTLSNTGTSNLKITQVRITCGCSAAEVKKKELAPGESTQLIAEILPESIAGPFSKGIFIHSNASNGRIQMLTLNGEALSLVTIAPQNMIFLGTLNIGKDYVQEFILKSSQKVAYATPKLSGTLIPKARLERISDNEVKLFLTFSPLKIQSRFNTTVKIKIQTPENWKDLEILLQGDVKSELKI